jgi:integrase
MIFKMPKVSFFLRSNNDKSRSKVLYCRISQNQTSAEFSLKEKIEPKCWDQVPQRMKTRCAQSNFVNTLIANVEYKIKTTALVHENYTAKQLISETFKVEKQVYVLDLIQKYQDHHANKLESGTIKTHTIRKNHLLDFELFLGYKLTDKTFTLPVAQKFIDWFQDTRKTDKLTAASRCVLFYKACLMHAYNRGEIGAPELAAFAAKRDKNKSVEYITLDELKRLELYQFQSPMLRKAKDLFVFQCHTGLSYCDLFGNWEIVERQNSRFIFGERAKSGQQYFTPIDIEAAAVLEHHGGKLPRLANAVYNRCLKEIAAILNISTNITTHTGRKTFATLADAKGYTRETVAKMLGHASIKTSEQYYIARTFERVENEVSFILTSV